MMKQPFAATPLFEGDVWEGRVSKIEPYGAFVKLGVVENHVGLVHISTLAEEKVENDLANYVESVVGPVGTLVRVQVLRLEFKGVRRVSLRLVEVVSQETIEEVQARALERTPRRGGIADDDDDAAAAIDDDDDELLEPDDALLREPDEVTLQGRLKRTPRPKLGDDDGYSYDDDLLDDEIEVLEPDDATLLNDQLVE